MKEFIFSKVAGRNTWFFYHGIWKKYTLSLGILSNTEQQNKNK